METLSILAISIVLAWLVMGGLAWLFSDRLIFPRPPPSYRSAPGFLELARDSGESFTAVYLPNHSTPQIVIYSHGNFEDLGRVTGRLEALRKLGVSVFAYDYPGYGTSEGTPTEASTNEALRECYEFVRDELRFAPENIILYGRSVGSGPTMRLASEEPVGGVIVESAFVSAWRVVTRVPLFPFDRFDNLSRIDRIDAPVLIIHGANDEVVPFWHGQALSDRAAEPKFHLWVENAGHNDIEDFAGELFWETIARFLRETRLANGGS